MPRPWPRLRPGGLVVIRILLELYRNIGTENGNCYRILGVIEG